MRRLNDFVIASRFLRTSDGQWHDLVTRLPADLVVGEQTPADEAAAGSDEAQLLDEGPLDETRWFRAFSPAPIAPPTDDELARVNRLVGHIDAPVQIGVRVEPAGGPLSLGALCVLARCLHARGFALVADWPRLSPALMTGFGHRHVVAVLDDDTDRAAALRWIRRLGRASYRAHVLLDAREVAWGLTPPAAADGREVLAREQAPAYAPRVSSPTHVHNRRADRLARRGRPGAAAAWARAAVGQPDARCRRVAMLACEGQFARAEHLLALVTAEAEIERCPSKDARLTAQATLAFWRDQPARALASADAVARPGPYVRLLQEVLRGRSGCDGRLGAAERAASALLESPSDWVWPRARDLAWLVRAESLLLSGHRTAARRAIGRLARDRPRLVGLLAAWLRAVAAGDVASIEDLRRQLRACSAPGISRWGMADREKQLLAALPQVLQVVAEARDEMEALAAACSWLMRQSEIGHAAVVAPGRVLAGKRSGLALAEAEAVAAGSPGTEARVLASGTQAVATAAIRYGGHEIAQLELSGLSRDAEALAQWAASVAPALASPTRARLDALTTAALAHARMPEIVGRSAVLAHVRDAVARAAATTFPVLIEGESGTGKELVARALHRLSARRDRPFCAVNCAAIADELLEAELFGHARGAFTGAVGARAGLFEDAHGGTLFLDEVADLSVRAQAKLLRAIQEREVRRVGENTARRIDVRVVCATNRPLTEAAAAGAFREDLVFRLAVVRIRLPPLRDRLEDVPVLALAFWRSAAADAGTRAMLAPDALAVLARHRWPGNVRELQNVMAAVALAAPAHGRVTARHVSQALRAFPAQPEFDGLALDEVRRRADRQAIAGALARHQGRRTAAARTLGVTRQGLAKAMRRVGLDAGPPTSGVA